ncbi:hypothetical protein AB1Y20_008218 [Prymnesium parvum]|uniref:CP-type G domain-containing protein n=1 Tax=Prymnesium parvum TaxID=97485 RepID=A0AB34IW29_PRYPA
MPRRGKSGGNKMSHSIKKLLRREGAHCGVKGKKSKLKLPHHPGAKPPSRRMQRAEARDGEAMAEATATSARAEARRQLGRAKRLEETARRRGLVVGGGAAALSGAPMEEAEAAAEAKAAAAKAATRALSCAPCSQRSFQRELAAVLHASDVLLEVLDARDPMGCRCVPLEEAVLQRFAGKRVVLVLNKVDLVPPEVTARWLAYLRQYFPTLPFKASTQQKDIGRAATHKTGALASYGSEAYGGEQLLQLLKNYSRSRGMKTAITVGIVGYPNVGKSSLINSLKRARAVNVGATPGVTTTAQTVAIDSKVKLMDCPGIVFARAASEEEAADVALRNCVRVEKLDDPVAPVEAILRRVGAAQLMAQYDVAPFDGAEQFLTLLAARRGHLRKGGGADHEAAARAVLHDWNSGVIRYHTEPPRGGGKVEVVAHLAAEFDWNAPVKTGGADEVVEASGSRAAAAARRAECKRVATTKRSPLLVSAASARAMVHQRLGDEHDQYNFQPNKAIRKQAKVIKKAKRKAAAASMQM